MASLSYLLRNKERIKDGEIVRGGVFGMLDKQVTRLDKASALMDETGWDIQELMQRLQRSSEVQSLQDFDLLYEILSLPKPTYLQGLNEEADEFVKRRASAVPSKNGHTPYSALSVAPLSEPVALKNVSITFSSSVRRTWQTNSIQQAFGISPSDISHEVVKDLSLDFDPGEVILLTGPSGAGKTTVLDLLAGKQIEGQSGEVDLPSDYRPGVFSPIRSKKALIEVVGGKDAKETLQLMGLVGISDAFVYLKRFDELSNGQQYRVMLARLIASGCNVWLADEFCANLDVVTANVVASRMQRVARQFGATLVVASSQPESFCAALKPDRVLRLTNAHEHRVMDGKSFLKALPRKGHSTFGPSSFAVAREYLQGVRSGEKRSTIRKGRVAVGEGLTLLTARGDMEPVNVLSSRCTRLNCVTEEEAQRDGFEGLEEFRAAIKRHYPKISDTSLVTIIEFEPLGNLKAAFEEVEETLVDHGS